MEKEKLKIELGSGTPRKKKKHLYVDVFDQDKEVKNTKKLSKKIDDETSYREVRNRDSIDKPRNSSA